LVIGRLELKPGLSTLQVLPVKKPRFSIMNLKQVRLVPAT
jgi:hypothetical protein